MFSALFAEKEHRVVFAIVSYFESAVCYKITSKYLVLMCKNVKTFVPVT